MLMEGHPASAVCVGPQSRPPESVGLVSLAGGASEKRHEILEASSTVGKAHAFRIRENKVQILALRLCHLKLYGYVALQKEDPVLFYLHKEADGTSFVGMWRVQFRRWKTVIVMMG